MEISLEQIWQDYGMDELSGKLDAMFPDLQIDLEDIFARILSGDVLGCLGDLFSSIIQVFVQDFLSQKNTFIWLLVLGVGAALLTNFVKIFDNHQVADVGFYFTYLLMVAILMKYFLGAAKLAAVTMEGIVGFIRIFIPAYFLAVGVSTGSMTAGAGYQLVILIIYLVENVLFTLVLPLINCYVLFVMINGLWQEERLGLLAGGLEKGIRFLLKISIGLVVGLNALQSMLMPTMDAAKASVVQKVLSSIPGVGDVADGVVHTLLSSAVIIKNSLGLLILILLIVVSAIPLFRILCTAFVLKVAAAILGVISDKRITTCTNKTGDGSSLLFRTVGSAILMFMITISVAAFTTNRGF